MLKNIKENLEKKYNKEAPRTCSFAHNIGLAVFTSSLVTISSNLQINFYMLLLLLIGLLLMICNEKKSWGWMIYGSILLLILIVFYVFFLIKNSHLT